MKVIADSAISNPRYAEDRSIEMIREAQRVLDQLASGPDQAKANREQYDRHMTQAIGLLALARAVRP